MDIVLRWTRDAESNYESLIWIAHIDFEIKGKKDENLPTLTPSGGQTKCPTELYFTLIERLMNNLSIYHKIIKLPVTQNWASFFHPQYSYPTIKIAILICSLKLIIKIYLDQIFHSVNHLYQGTTLARLCCSWPIYSYML